MVLIDAGAPRNAPADGVHNYLYSEGAPPSQLAEIGRAEATGYSVDIIEGTATEAAVIAGEESGGSGFTVGVKTGDGRTVTVTARRLLLATGLVDVLPDIPGLRARWGRDVLHCPFCHGWEVRDQPIGVIGTGPMSLHGVLLFRALSADVVYFQHTAPDLTEAQREQLAALDVRHVLGVVAALESAADTLTGVRMDDGHVISRRAVAVAPRVYGRDDLVVDLGLSMSDLEVGGDVIGRYLAADPSGATSTPGVWAAGNVNAPMAQVINAAAAGAGAGAAIHLDLVNEDSAAASATYPARVLRNPESTHVDG